MVYVNNDLFATVNTENNPPRVSIRKPLRDLGFDVNLRYELLFDKTTDCIVLEPTEYGNAVANVNSNYYLSAKGFISFFGLTGAYQADMAWWDEELHVWQLHVVRPEGA